MTGLLSLERIDRNVERLPDLSCMSPDQGPGVARSERGLPGRE